MTSEGEIYVWTKKVFRGMDWNLLAGDPPRGTDIPRLEIKEPGATQSVTKNKNAIINDLVYCKKGFLALIECKDEQKKTGEDVQKLRKLRNTPSWRDSLVTAMSDRSLLNRDGSPSVDNLRRGNALIPVLAYPGKAQSSLPEFVQITFQDGNENITIGESVPAEAQQFFRDIT